MDSVSKEIYYRCYFTMNDHIVAHEAIYCADDAAAIEKARALLAATSFLSLEVWRGAAYVAKLDKDEGFVRGRRIEPRQASESVGPRDERPDRFGHK